jgi:hypothetical protein
MRTLDTALVPFLDAERRLKAWPRRQRVQLLALQAVAEEFESSRRYTEPEVDGLIGACHTFGDATRIRRALVDWGFIGRERDGSAYWLITTAPPRVT